jgi:hypothetical protein
MSANPCLFVGSIADACSMPALASTSLAPPPARSSAPWLADGYPGHMPVPTMLARAEIDYLHRLARRSTGRGRIVELGCFLGGSTMALAAGMAANPRASTNLLTYDAFRMDPHSAATFATGIPAGQSFRPIFESYLRDHLPRITIREGWIPEELPTRDSHLALYPEQERIEILFVDTAKKWLVHNTLLSCFGPHLIPGQSILVQQDFKHFGAYWIALHMQQLASCFQPLHDVADASTVSFLYTPPPGGIEDLLPRLLRPEDVPLNRIDSLWDLVDDQWAACPTILPLMHLRRGIHLLHAGQSAAGLRVIEHIAGAHGRGDSPPSLIRRELACALQWALRKGHIAPGQRQHCLTLAEQIRGDTKAEETRRARREQVIQRCLARGWTRIALFGAGRHTVELLQSGWPHGQLEIVAILDDHSPATNIAGIPIARPRELAADIDAIIISSEVSEHLLAAAAERALPHLPILRIYAPA